MSLYRTYRVSRACRVYGFVEIIGFMWLIGFIGFRVIGITSDLCGGSRAYGTRGFHGALKGLYRSKDSSLHPEGLSFVLLGA